MTFENDSIINLFLLIYPTRTRIKMMKRFIGSNSLLLNYAKKSNKIRNIKKILLDTPPESPKSYLNWLSQLKK